MLAAPRARRRGHWTARSGFASVQQERQCSARMCGAATIAHLGCGDEGTEEGNTGGGRLWRGGLHNQLLVLPEVGGLPLPSPATGCAVVGVRCAWGQRHASGPPLPAGRQLQAGRPGEALGHGALG